LRRRAAQAFSVDEAVLRKLGRLASDVGDAETGRKITARGERRRHTPEETAWTRSAIRMLIRRAGERAHDPSAQLPLLGMADV